MKFPRFFIIFSVIFLFFGLSACALNRDDIVGTYTCARLELNGEEYHVLDIYPDGCSLQLSKWGQAWLNIEDDSFYGRWELEGNTFSLDINGELSSGILSDGLCVLQFAQGGMEHSFLKEGASFPESLPVIQKPLTEQQLFWNGDWYGFWTITNADGIWKDQSGQSFDCFASIEIDDKGKGTMIFWDELQDKSQAIACAELSINNTKNDNAGIAVSTGGYFLDTELTEKQWQLDPDSYKYDSVFYLENVRYEGADGGFDYSVLLRPWGRTWEDIEAVEPDMLPYFYYDWYLPSLASGALMPDCFSYASDTVIRNTFTENE